MTLKRKHNKNIWRSEIGLKGFVDGLPELKMDEIKAKNICGGRFNAIYQKGKEVY
jgi:hypothetical protein